MVEPKGKMVKLHLGCGSRYLEGFIHIDLAKYNHIDYVKPIYPLPFIKNETVDEIYCSHAFEYYDYQQAYKVLKEWKRCLVNTGVIRLSVPDFDQLLEVYKLNDKNIDSIIGPLFGRWEVADGQYIYHKTVYTREKIVNILIKLGFKSIRNWYPLEYFGKGNECFDDYSKAYFPHLDFENGLPISINILAEK